MLTYDYGERVAWLDRLVDISGNAWPLCSTHADGLKVPLGWTKEDRRVPALPMPAEPMESLAV